MSQKISPLIFFSISRSGKEMSEAIQKYSENIKHPVYSRFVKFITYHEDGALTNSVNDKKLLFSFKGDNNIKQNNFAVVNKQRQEYLSVFEEVKGDIRNIENNHFANEKNFQIEKTQVIILSEIDEPNLIPLTVPLIQGIDSADFKFHFLLLYNTSVSKERTNTSRILRNSFFREIETMGNNSPEVWLLDIVNDQDLNLKEKTTLLDIASQFVDLLMTEQDKIDVVNYNNRGNVQGKLCRYSSIGYSVIKYPVEKAKSYMSLFGYTNEYQNLINRFELKFESILLKDELSRFLSSKGFFNTPERLSKKGNSDEIFTAFNYKLDHLKNEKEQVLLRNLSPVDNISTLSTSTTSEVFRQIDVTAEDYFNNIFIEFSGHINSSRERELSIYLKEVRDAQEKFINEEDRSLNYAILFAAILCNNRAVVEPMLEGRFSDDIPTLYSVEDKYREKFIGDEISKISKEKNGETLNCSNKKKLVEEYTHKLEEDSNNLEVLKTADPENPKFPELEASIVNYDKQIIILKAEIKQHNKNITRLSTKAEDIKIQFDRDATKESYKIERNENLLKEIENLRENQIPAIDKSLADKYSEKNISLKRRKKHIVYNLIIIPSSILILSLLIQFILYNIFEGFDAQALRVGVGMTLVAILIFYIINLFRFYKMSQEFKILLGEIGDQLNKKRNLFQKYVSIKNQVYKNDFDFEVDLISLSIIKKLIAGVLELQQKVENFRNKIISDSQSYGELMRSYEFVENSYELGVLEKSDLENIYKKYSGKKLFYSSSDNQLSIFFNLFEEKGNLNDLEEFIDQKVLDVCSRKLETENLKSILFNETSDFGKINTAAKLKILFETSRPLLRTPKHFFANIGSDVPYTENVIIGNFDQKYAKYWAESDISFNHSVKINETNENILGILSIKSNFPAFLIYDVKENEEVIRNEVGLDDKKKYFISDSAFEHQLMPLNIKVNQDKEILMGDELISALVNGLIEYDSGNKKFHHPILGDLGFTFEELVKYWNSPICYEINKKAGEINSEIWKFEEDEMTNYLTQFKSYWTQFGAVVPRNYEVRLSEYFFQRDGREEHWNQIKAAIKQNRKKLVNSMQSK